MPAIKPRVRITGTPVREPPADAAVRSLAVPLEAFAWEAIEEESARLGVSVEDLAAFAVLYYLADVDSGRIARRIGASPRPPDVHR
jgi:hypothetical protein